MASTFHEHVALSSVPNSGVGLFAGLAGGRVVRNDFAGAGVDYITPGHFFLDELGGLERIDIARVGFTSQVNAANGSRHELDGEPLQARRTGALHGFSDFLDRSYDVELVPPFDAERGWTTYNFEVEHFHTYIADGIRVHNDSQEVIDAAGAIGQAFGTQLALMLTEGESQFVELAAGTVLGTVTRNLAEVISDIGLHGFVGKQPEYGIQTVWRGGVSELGDIHLDLVTAGLGTASSFLTAELAEELGLEAFTAGLFNVAVGSVTGSVLNQVVSVALSSQHAGGIATAINALDFQQALATLPSATGAFFGSQLANEILPPQTVAGSIGSSLGAIAGVAYASASIYSTIAAAVVGQSLGATIGGIFGNFIIPGIGAFFGTLIGTFLGDLFGGDPEPRGYGSIFVSEGTMTVLESVRTLDDFPRDIINSWVDATKDASQRYLELTGGVALSNEITTFPDAYRDGKFVETGQNTQRVYISVDDDSGGELNYYYYEGFAKIRASTMTEMVDRGITNFIKEAEVVGGDILLKRAVGNSDAKDMTNLAGHMAVAENYTNYLDNRDIINALIVAQPDTVFAAGWAISLLQTQELGLSETSFSDFNGGLRGLLASLEFAGLATTAGDVIVSRNGATNQITVDVALGEGEVVPGTAAIFADDVREMIVDGRRILRLTFDNGLADGGFVMNGTATTSRDIWFAGDDHSHTFSDVNAGVSDPTIGANEDILIGGMNGDMLAGGAGDDWIDGRAGGDILSGDDGVDVLLGREGGDWLDGGHGDDMIEGGPGADVIDGGDKAKHAQELAALQQKHRDELGDGGLTDEQREAEQAFARKTLPNQNTASYGSSAGSVYVNLSLGTGSGHDAEGDTLRDIAQLIGSAFGDNLYGNGSANSLEGGAGADTLDGGSDAPSDAYDTASYYFASAGVAASLLSPSTNTGDARGDVYRRIEGLLGSIHDDVLEGDNGSNQLAGGYGNDILIAGHGADYLFGGHGVDIASYRNFSEGITLDLSDKMFEDSWSTSAFYADRNDNDHIISSAVIRDDLFNSIEGFEGTNFADSIYGSSDVDYLLGGLGDDYMEGRDASDQLEGGEGNDILLGGAGADLIDGGAGNDQLDGGGGADRLYGGDGHDHLNGDDGDDVLEGGRGDDVIVGLSGNDVLKGGTGNDTYHADAGDTVAENAGEGYDRVYSYALQYALTANVESLVLASGAFAGFGNELDNDILGSTGDNVLLGGAGNDTLNGAGGNDRYEGGTGNDTYHADAGDTVAENAGEGYDRVYSYLSDYSLAANVEALTLGSGALVGRGNELDNDILGSTGDNVLLGGAGNDTLNGAGGNDRYEGGTGNDTYHADAGDTVAENAGEGYDRVYSYLSDYSLAANVEALTLGSGALVGRGNELDNDITGNTADNMLVGGAGNDTMSGGIGNDVYEVTDAGDTVAENVGEGYDRVYSYALQYALTANVESLVLASGAFAGFGNELDNDILGSTGDNVLLGGAGNDTLNGAGGNDRYEGGTGNDTYHADAGDTVAENAGEGYDRVYSYALQYALTANVESLVLASGAFAGFGNELDNDILGSTGDNVLLGGAGNDTLNGAGGNDRYEGGTGNDTYHADAGDTVAENAGEGYDRVYSYALQYALTANVESLVLASGAFAGFGNELDNDILGSTGDNVLLGGAGNDTLNGAGGNDRYEGGTGNDTYHADAGDTVAENAGEGYDRVYSYLSDYSLAANVEALTLGSGALVGRGNELDNDILGSTGDNVLLGGAGNDTLNGAGGNDRYEGGTGNDTYHADAGDTVAENAGEGYDRVYSYLSDYSLAANVEALTLGSGALVGRGNELDNDITGNTADNMLVGGAGNDTMSGGIGNDVYEVTDAGDTVAENVGEGYDRVYSYALQYALTANVESLVLASGAFAGFGNELDNDILGSTGDNVLLGGAGNDTLNGAGGNDRYEGGTGNDTYHADAGDTVAENVGEGYDRVYSYALQYALTANVESLVLASGAFAGFGNELDNDILGSTGDNVLLGGAGNDTLNGAGGNDRYEGGTGNDTYHADAGDTVAENVGEGYDRVYSYLSDYSLAANVEALTLGSGALVGRGNELDNDITGNTADNMLVGGAGNDTMSGGIGNDVYEVTDAGDTVAENVGEGYDRVYSYALQYALTANVESLVLASGAFAGFGNELDNDILGSTGDNVLLGGAGNDTLNGAGGNDRYEGGTGNDTYHADAGDTVAENAGEGYDRVYSYALQYALTANVESLVLASGAFAGFGNELDNDILGSTGDNVLLGGAGNDTLNGAGGNDRYEGGTGNDTYHADAGDTVAENVGEGYDRVYSYALQYALTANVESLVLASGAFAGFGNELDNDILGSTGDNVLLGGAGNDTLNGAGGNDRYEGGTGNDTYHADAGDTVAENVGEGYDRVYSYLSDYSLAANVEALTLGSGALVGRGNELDNDITGNTADNMLVGGAGNDTMSGGIGNDVYEVTDAGDTVAENVGEGYDRVYSYALQYALTANVESLVLASGAFAGFGNELDNDILGSTGDNVLLGGAGNDTLNGAGGNDRYEGGTGNDTYHADAGDTVAENAGEGYDRVYSYLSDYSLAANVEALTLGSGALVGRGNELDNDITGNTADNMLVGGAGNDTMSGGIGNDRMNGSEGDDVLTGGSGSDTFAFNVGFGNDVITDFVAGAGLIDLIEFDTSIFATYAALAAASSQSGADTLITVDASNILTLKNIGLGSLHNDDFRFI